MNKRWPQIAGILLFLMLCVSATYWAMQLFQPPPRPVAAPPRAAAPEIQPQAAAALFGGRADVAAASNFKLHGVIYAGNPRESVAIVSTDGKPAQAVRVGAEVVPGVTVKEVHRGYVLLAEGGAIKRVDLPEEAENRASVATTSPVPSRPVAPRPPPAAAEAPPPPPAPAPGTETIEGAQGVPGAAEAAREQRAFEQRPAEFAPDGQPSVTVNPGGGVSTEMPTPPPAGG